jgi:hypothetical protein
MAINASIDDIAVSGTGGKPALENSDLAPSSTKTEQVETLRSPRFADCSKAGEGTFLCSRKSRMLHITVYLVAKQIVSMLRM